MIYVEPALFRDVLGGTALYPSSKAASAPTPACGPPPTPCSSKSATRSNPWSKATPRRIGPRARRRVRPAPDARRRRLPSARRAREYLHAQAHRVVTLEELEHATGRDRWSLCRDFRTFYGTTPTATGHAPLGHRTPADAARPQPSRRGCIRRLRRPEPHDPPLHQDLRPHPARWLQIASAPRRR